MMPTVTAFWPCSRLYGWNGRGAWEQRGSDIDGEAAGDQSGFAVSLSSDGRVVAIGANANDDSGDLAGHVRLYAVGGFDVFPEDRNESVDTDQDGIGNNADTDDDGDGVLDRDDAFPLDPSRSVDGNSAPTIAIEGAATMTLNIGEVWNDPGVLAD